MQAVIAKSLAYGDTRLPPPVRRMSWSLGAVIAFFFFGLLISEGPDEDLVDAPEDLSPPVASEPPPGLSMEQRSLREVIEDDPLDREDPLRVGANGSTKTEAGLWETP